MMEEELEIPTVTSPAVASPLPAGFYDTSNGEAISTDEPSMFSDDIDSSCSTPYVSAPSSPGRGQPLSGFYYSAPASPMHFVLSTSSLSAGSISSQAEASPGTCSFEFDFSARLVTNGSAAAGSMSSADELFLNGQIRPMKLSTHLQRPQVLAPLLDLEENEDAECDKLIDIVTSDEKASRGRDLKLRDRSLRRRTRSMSPLRSTTFQWHDEDYEEDEGKKMISKESTENKNEETKQDDEGTSNDTTPCPSGSSSRSSSVGSGRNSRRWVFLKEFLYRSKSEGRNNTHKFWSSLSFSPIKEKKLEKISAVKTSSSDQVAAAAASVSLKVKDANANGGKQPSAKEVKKKPVNGVGKRRVPPSPHELHYTANRAQAEEMRKKTFLPYRQGLLGCLGFSSKSYGAMNGFARALNPVSSR